jgi:nitroimidazol reductase NimA-like FMN-containing flavoprotein (pyridoxamine 5'-phosphate oxidase superfamily)
MPGYGVLGPSEGGGLLPWAWAETRLVASRNYWLSTASESGRPHAMPVWGIWLADAFFFSTGTQSRKARHLARDPRCCITTEHAAEAVIVEGTAAPLADASLAAAAAERYAAKYGQPPPPPWYRVQPEVVFGLIEQEALFAGTATRWRLHR